MLATALPSWVNLDASVFVVLVGTLYVTYRSLQNAKEATHFSAMVRVHELIASDEGRRMRRYLHREFSHALTRVVQAVFDGEDLVTDGKVDARKVRESPPGGWEERLGQFNSRLQSEMCRPAEGDTPEPALEVVEKVLADLDVIALPFYEDLEGGTALAHAYGDVIESTAPILIPFLAIQMKLRDQTAREYKKQYIYMIDKLGLAEKLSGFGVCREPGRSVSRQRFEDWCGQEYHLFFKVDRLRIILSWSKRRTV